MEDNPRLARRLLPPWIRGKWGAIALFSTLYTLVYLAWIYFHWGGEENVTLIGDLFYLPLDLLVVFSAWYILTQENIDLRIRRMWFLLGLGFLAYFIGDVIWSYIENMLDVPPFPAVSDIFYLLFAPLVAAGLFFMPSAPLQPRQRWQYLSDLSIIMVTTSMLMWYFIIQPTAVSNTGDLIAQAVAVAYPISDVIVIVGIIGAVLRQPDSDTRSVLRLLFFGMLFFVSADVIYGYTSLSGTYVTGSWIDAGWIIAHLFFLFAALRQMYRAPANSEDSRSAKIRDGFIRALPGISAGISGILAIGLVITDFSAQASWLVSGAALVVVLMIARQLGQPGIQIRLTVLILIITVPMLIGSTAFLSARATAELEEKAHHDLSENNYMLATNVSTWLDLHIRTLQELALLPDIGSMDASRQRSILRVIAAAHPNLYLVHTTDLSGVNVARNDDSEPKDYHDRGWFHGAKSGAPVTFEVLIGRTTGKPALSMAMPIRSETGQIVGVVSIVSELNEISREVTQAYEGEHSISYIVDASNRVVAHPDPTYTAEELRDLSAYPPVVALREGQSGWITFTDENNEVWRAYISKLDNGWGIITQQTEIQLLGSVHQFQRTMILLIALGTAIMLAAAWFTIRRTLKPIATLTNTVSAIAAGDINRIAQVESEDEIGTLAATFNSMTAQLRDLIGSLEQRVADRTKALASVAEVSSAASTVLDTDALLKRVVDLAKERFGFYHAHIYLLDQTGTSLVLSAGAGQVGRQMVANGHAIPLDREQSLVARAAREKQGVTVNDVTSDPDFLPNPLLPDTHSELAVPMLVGDQVIGVFDVQSELAGRFTDADIAVQTTLASQVASAVQNARSYTEMQRSQALLSEALNISRLANWEYDVEKDLFHFNDHFYSIFRTGVEKVGSYQISSADYARNFVHPDDAALVGSEIQKVLESKERHLKTTLEHRIIFSDGEIGYISVKINVDRDENGKILRWYGANQDVTERRGLEELNRKRATQQEAINLITQKIQDTTSIESALQIAARELGHALGQKQTLVSLQPSALAAIDQDVVSKSG